MIQKAIWGAALVVFCGVSGLNAAEVTVKGVHLCCGGCVNDVKSALQEVEGVSDVAGDPNTKVVVFKTTDAKVAEAGLLAMAKAGFHGTPSIDKKPVVFPGPTIEKGTKSNSITVTGVHLCCGACVTGVKKALEGVEGVQEMKIDRESKTVSVSGKDIDVAGFIDALYRGGYHGELKKAKT